MKQSYHAYRRRLRRIECAGEAPFQRAVDARDVHLAVAVINHKVWLRKQARRSFDARRMKGVQG